MNWKEVTVVRANVEYCLLYDVGEVVLGDNYETRFYKKHFCSGDRTQPGLKREIVMEFGEISLDPEFVSKDPSWRLVKRRTHAKWTLLEIKELIGVQAAAVIVLVITNKLGLIDWTPVGSLVYMLAMTGLFWLQQRRSWILRRETRRVSRLAD